jgi:cystathionine gamma-synthase
MPMDFAYGSIASPIYLSTTFERDADGRYSRGYEYARDGNPNRAELERALATLEGGHEAAAFASGSAAAMTLFQALRPGEGVVVSEDCYWGVRQMLDRVFTPWGLVVRYVDASNSQALKKAATADTRLIFIETPSNPMLKITDIREAAQIAHACGAFLACDNTAAPLLQRPLELGADIVVHSTTKYISGHHDAMGGALVARDASEFWNRIRFAQTYCGCVPSPFASWLTTRALPSLRHRMRIQSEAAFFLAQELERHGAIERVLHPWLPSQPGSEAARRQMSGAGALFSILVAGGGDGAMRVAANVRLFKRATSFGGQESLIEHRASVEAPGTKTPVNLLRLAIGLEDPQELLDDLLQALERV